MGGTLAVRREIVAVCRRLWERGLIAGPDGNVSVRLDERRLLVTPSGMSKVDVGPDDLVEVGLDGERLRGYREPSSEVYLHVRVYSRRPDVRAVVHAHPPAATGFAVAGRGIDAHVLPEIVLQMGEVPVVPYETPGTAALADRCESTIDAHDAFLLANHGAVTVGPSLEIAHQRMESLEHAARILIAARLVGKVNELSPSQVSELHSARARTGVSGASPGSTAPRSQRGES
ncbi:MAG TPA: class II aldolase/adducin family protein [Gemmatimonadaceae bacterium]